MWYKSFGWQENPFSIKTNTNLIGVNERKKELINYILSGDICFLNGPTGVGKSSMLRLVRKELKRHKVIYIDAAGVDDNFSITKHLQKFTPIWHKIAGKRFPPNSVILLDESQECDEELVKALKLHWDHENIKSIVITQINPNLNGFSESFRARVGNRIVKLNKISKSNAYDLVKYRTKNKNPFDSSAIAAIAEYANYIPRQILETCEVVCAKLYKKKTSEINAFDVEDVLKEFKKKEEPQTNSFSLRKPKEEEETIETNHISIRLSPMEKNIIDSLRGKQKTAQDLADSLKTTEGSVGKQLSKLMKKNIIKITDHERPKKYGMI
ncbi:hypothetical protein CL617_00220 [archaeon]|nr:hypothetical protein [archaeon]|tara:strand:+ start:13118 stop:14092 length:975 start_codon:yes stop_codon:yes gene_type:complete